MSVEIKKSPELARLELVIERMQIALYAFRHNGGASHEKARRTADALEFEIAPLLDDLDFDMTIARIAQDAINAYEKERGIKRSVLTLQSRPGPYVNDERVTPGQQVMLVARPQSIAMRIERLAIPDRLAAHFVIHDVRVGNRSQLENVGPLAGELFAVSRKGPSPITFETIQTAMDFVLIIEYVGDNPDGEAFLCNAIGIVPRYDTGHDNVALGYDPAWGGVETHEHLGDDDSGNYGVVDDDE